MEKDNLKTVAADKFVEWRQLRAGQKTLQTTNGAVAVKAAANVLARVFAEENMVSSLADRIKDIRARCELCSKTLLVLILTHA